VIRKVMTEFSDQKDEWYSEMAELIPQLYHLEPPDGVNALR